MANDNDPKSAGESEDASGLKIGDTLKKVITAGIGAAFMTEESIRNYLSDLKLPKEAMNLVLQSAAKSKEELMNKVGNEIIKVVNKIDFVKEASRFVEEHKFKIKAEVEVVKRDSTKGDSSSDSI
ncbi:MAG: hypothetical protein AB7N80_08605 [Bdellovibrionales bacterium]